MGLLDLMRDSGQKLLEVGQEVRLVPPQLRPEAAHLPGAGGRREGGIDSVGVKVTVKVTLVVAAMATLTPQTHD